MIYHIKKRVLENDRGERDVFETIQNNFVYLSMDSINKSRVTHARR